MVLKKVVQRYFRFHEDVSIRFTWYVSDQMFSLNIWLTQLINNSLNALRKKEETKQIEIFDLHVTIESIINEVTWSFSFLQVNTYFLIQGYLRL